MTLLSRSQLGAGPFILTGSGAGSFISTRSGAGPFILTGSGGWSFHQLRIRGLVLSSSQGQRPFQSHPCLQRGEGWGLGSGVESVLRNPLGTKAQGLFLAGERGDVPRSCSAQDLWGQGTEALSPLLQDLVPLTSSIWLP